MAQKAPKATPKARTPRAKPTTERAADVSYVIADWPMQKVDESDSDFAVRLDAWSAPMLSKINAELQALLDALPDDLDAKNAMPGMIPREHAKHVARYRALDHARAEIHQWRTLWEVYDFPTRSPKDATEAIAIDLAQCFERDSASNSPKLNAARAAELAMHLLRERRPLPRPLAAWLERGLSRMLNRNERLHEALGLAGDVGRDTPIEAERKARADDEMGREMAMLIAHGAKVIAAAELVHARAKLERDNWPLAWASWPALPNVDTIKKKWGKDWKHRFPHKPQDWPNVMRLAVYDPNDFFGANAHGYPEAELKKAREAGLKL